MSDVIIVSELPDTGALRDSGTDAHDVRIELPMTAHDRRRVRRIVDAPDGARLALELPTGTVLTPGQVLHRAGGRSYVVGAAPEDVIVARPRDLDEAARLGHLIGNLHRDLEARGGAIVALADPALADRLRRAGVPFDLERRAFHGRAPGEHAH
jgi:urease accessory protein